MRVWMVLIAVSVGSIGLRAQNASATTGVQPSAVAPRLDAVHNVDPTQMYHRVYARVPIVGSGKRGDPFRPMLAPSPTAVSTDHTGILAYQMQISDDGKWALVEFVGATPQDLQPVVSAAGPSVQVFERGKNSQAEIEAAFQVFKKGFKLDSFSTRAQ